jgi:uncharacterized protein
MNMTLAAGVCGLIFGLGLLISGMAQPSKVLGFLDLYAIRTGGWDPSLALVMAAALAVSTLGYAYARQRGAPLLAPAHLWPSRNDIDGRLVAGAILFGIGWGLVGLCPGPALVDLATLLPGVLAFVGAMIAGMLVHDLVWAKRDNRPKAPAVVDG